MKDQVRFASYVYITNIYSLFISGLIALLKGSLTHNDAIFILSVILSPATFCHWDMSFRYIYKAFKRGDLDKFVNTYGFSGRIELWGTVMASLSALVVWIVAAVC